jgi:hypothetical protein
MTALNPKKTLEPPMNTDAHRSEKAQLMAEPSKKELNAKSPRRSDAKAGVQWVSNERTSLA